MSSTVTKNVFESLAATINDLPLTHVGQGGTVEVIPRLKRKQRAEIALHVAEALVATNDRFDPVRFIRACGVTSADLTEQGIAAHSTLLRLRINALSRTTYGR